MNGKLFERLVCVNGKLSNCIAFMFCKCVWQSAKSPGSPNKGQSKEVQEVLTDVKVQEVLTVVIVQEVLAVVKVKEVLTVV